MPAFTGQDINKYVVVQGDEVVVQSAEDVLHGIPTTRDVLWRGARHFDLSGTIESVEPWVGGQIFVEGFEVPLENPHDARPLSGKEAAERNHKVDEQYRQRKEALHDKFYPPALPAPKFLLSSEEWAGKRVWSPKGELATKFFERNRAPHEPKPPAEEGEAPPPVAAAEEKSVAASPPLSPRRQVVLNERLTARHHDDWRESHSSGAQALAQRKAERMDFLGLRAASPVGDLEGAPSPKPSRPLKPSPPATPKSPAHRPAPRRPASARASPRASSATNGANTKPNDGGHDFSFLFSGTTMV